MVRHNAIHKAPDNGRRGICGKFLISGAFLALLVACSDERGADAAEGKGSVSGSRSVAAADAGSNGSGHNAAHDHTMSGHEHHSHPSAEASEQSNMSASQTVEAEGLAATGAYLRQPAPGQSVLAAFVTFRNSTSSEYALTNVSSARARSVEMHRTFYEEGVMRMRAVSSLTVPPQGKLVFKPGGYHLMLSGVEGTLKPGDQVPLRFTFQSGLQLDVQAEVRPLR